MLQFPCGHLHGGEINLGQFVPPRLPSAPRGENPPGHGTPFVLKPVGSPRVQTLHSEDSDHQWPVLGRFCSTGLIILKQMEGSVVEILEKRIDRKFFSLILVVVFLFMVMKVRRTHLS